MNTLIAQDAATPPDDSTRLIALTKGKVAVVDAADYEWLSQWNWSARFDRARNRWYAQRSFFVGSLKKQIVIPMHRAIMCAKHGIQVDHEDGDGLHNWRGNLRIASNQQNACNRGPQRNNKSGFKGVSWKSDKQRWRAQIEVNGRSITLGAYRDKLEAAAAYETAAKKYHGEFARTKPFLKTA